MFAALPIEAVGHWWIPGKSIRARGTLRITEQGQATLEFDDYTEPGWLPDDIAVDPATAVTRVRAVHGSVGGRRVTVLDCQFRVSTWYQATRIQDGIADAVIYGAHSDSADDEMFRSVEIELEHLTAWTAKKMLRDDTPPSPAVIVEIPGSITADTDDGPVALQWNVKREGTPTAAGNVRHLFETTNFVVSRDRLSARAARNETLQYQHLITFATRKSSGPLSVRLLPLADLQKGPASGLAEYFFPTVVKADTSIPPLTYHQMAFCLNDVDFQDLIARWPKIQDVFQGPLAALLGFRYSSEQYIQNQVVLLVAAAEQAYAASNLKESFITASEVRKVRKLIREALRKEGSFDDSDVRAIAEKVDGRLTLEKRLRKLAEYVGAVDAVFGGSANLETWIRAAKSSRNSLAHTGDDRRRNILTLRAIAFAAEALVELAVLKAVGFEEAQLSEISRKHHLHVKRWIENEINSNDHSGSR
jgi:hypothetical protein